jgi:predicted  nucleic acid-binding Zn-ribbon protein
LGEKEKLLQESLRTIQELRVKKESLETEIETFDLESKEKCTEYNTKIFNLNLEIKDKTKLIEMLSGEKELLLSDLKNMTSDRDQIQKQCSNALKEITELAVSDPFGCASHDLGRLDVSVSWIKSKCLELNNENLSMILELSTLKQTIRELDDNFNSCKNDLTAMHKALENEKVKSENYSKQIKNSEVKITELNEQINDFIRFKEKISEILKVPNDLNVLDKAIESISRPSLDSEIKSLNSEVLKKTALYFKLITVLIFW